MLAGVDSGELDVRDDDVGEALLADVAAPAPRLSDYTQRLRERRVLAVTGVGATLPEARRRAYEGAALVTFEGRVMRSDIALAVA